MEGERKQTTVRVRGLIYSGIAVAYSASHPDISLHVEDGATDSLSLQQSMVSGDDSVDLYVLSTVRSYGEVKEKGYAAPMNASGELVTEARRFYPAIQHLDTEPHRMAEAGPWGIPRHLCAII